MNNQVNVNNNGNMNPQPVNNIPPQTPPEMPVNNQMPNPQPVNSQPVNPQVVNNQTPEMPVNNQPIDDNRFINQETNSIPNQNVSNQNENALNNLNVQGNYNNLQAPEYVNDQKVIENIQGQTKKTVPITKELKTVIVIALVLLAFIIFMPMIFDFLNNIRFH